MKLFSLRGGDRRGVRISSNNVPMKSWALAGLSDDWLLIGIFALFLFVCAINCYNLNKDAVYDEKLSFQAPSSRFVFNFFAARVTKPISSLMQKRKSCIIHAVFFSLQSSFIHFLQQISAKHIHLIESITHRCRNTGIHLRVWLTSCWFGNFP